MRIDPLASKGPLRERAELIFKETAARSLQDLQASSPELAMQALQELGVHQIELELQNEELRRTQVQLYVSNQRYIGLYDLAPVGYCTLSEAGSILQANLTSGSLLGMARDAMLDVPLSRFIFREDQDIYYLTSRKLMRERRPQCCELRMVRVDGAQIWVKLAIKVEEDEAAQVTFLVALSDITERKQAAIAKAASERALEAKEANQRIEGWSLKVAIDAAEAKKHAGQLADELEVNRALMTSIIDESLSLIYATDLEGRFLIVNRAFENRFGRCRLELLGRTRADALSEIMPAEVAAEHFRNDQLVVAKGHSYEVEETNEEPDGTHFYISQKHPLRDLGGRIFGVAGISTDLTGRKNLELALQGLVKDKESLLKEVHHRVKNNLQVISSLLSLEARRSKSAVTEVVIDDMKNRIFAMAQLHESLYRSGTFASVDLGAYLGQLAKHSFRALSEHNGLVQLKLNMGSVTVGMDQAGSAGLLLNELISNCLKHGFPEGSSGEIGVELQPFTDAELLSDSRWCLRVSDTGVGIPSDLHEKRAASFGLQLASDLSQQLGGTLTICSPAGGGSQFSIVFTAMEPKAMVMP
jgi:PAS domain S-box-containing protein